MMRHFCGCLAAPPFREPRSIFCDKRRAVPRYMQDFCRMIANNMREVLPTAESTPRKGANRISRDEFSGDERRRSLADHHVRQADVRLGSNCEKLSVSKCFPVHPTKRAPVDGSFALLIMPFGRGA